MNKNLQLVILFIFTVLGFGIQAQDTLLVERFDDSTLGQFTQFSEVGAGETWGPADFNDRFFAQMNGFNGEIQDNIDWLLSPALDMDLYENEVLFFENASNFSGPDLELLYSTDYDGNGDPTSATWTDISAGVTWSPGGYEYVSSGNIDLSAVTGTAYIALRYTSNADVQGKLFQIDDFIIVPSTTNNTSNFEVTELITKPYVSNDNLVFSTLDQNTKLNVIISSMSGSQVSQQSVSGNVSLSLLDLPRGAYVLIVSHEGKTGSFKFVK